MRDTENLNSQLAKEEATLAATNEQIEAAYRRIEALQAQITAAQEKIAATEQGIDKLRESAVTIEKRMELLREYMSMVENSPAPVAINTPAPGFHTPAPARHTPPPAVHTPVPATHTPVPATPAEPSENDSTAEILPSLEEAQPTDEIGDLAFVESLPGATADAKKEASSAPVTLETLDDEVLSHELLPRTQTFEEELLLVMAHHRKAIAPKDVARIFRRLDYTPKQSATAKTIRAQVEAAQHLFETAAEGRIALTGEGREEAQRLIEQLA
jgi:hypothetical protein